jgi:3-methyladenine DNA glycosylase AlkC
MPDALKDLFYQSEFYEDVIEALKEIYPDFNGALFKSTLYDRVWQERSLKERMRHTSLALAEQFPADFQEALHILRQLLPRVKKYGFEKMIFPDYVELFGLDNWEASLSALEEFTQQMSAEFAVRRFIIKDPDRMMCQMLTWAEHDHESVRRLASEGCRPRLPWAVALTDFQKNPELILPVLEKLKNDPSESVRRSVANNLNDISKDHPQIVVDLLQNWQQDESTEMKNLIKHALRTLIKQGHMGALQLLGYSQLISLSLKDFSISPIDIKIGESIKISFSLISNTEKTNDLMIDYGMYFMRSNGKPTRKVFKLAQKTIRPGETLMFTKTHSFAEITTRRYYPGKHAVEIQVNGQVLGKQEFNIR